jgi:hypothetical protein
LRLSIGISFKGCYYIWLSNVERIAKSESAS